MLYTVIVGGGLCGLALANKLHGQGQTFALYEARNRLGGRILSVKSSTTGMAMDLGPTWFWPDTQPRMNKLVAELGLENFSQHDNGSVLHLNDPEKKPESISLPDVHGGARRLAGGMATLTDTLAARVPSDAIHLEQQLAAVRDKGNHVELLFHCRDVTTIVRARRAVLAIPPRLLEERVHFEPALDGVAREAMRTTPTWMAGQAKVVVAYELPFWRAAGESGNAFVSHEQAVLAEIFDACDASGHHAALGGFLALSPQFRASIHPTSLPMLISSQLVQVFGLEGERGEQHLHDWAAEPFTCATLDLTPPDTHPEYGNPNLRQPLWSGKLILGGSETAGNGCGYMEGALETAARIQRTLAADVDVDVAVAVAVARQDGPRPANNNDDCLTRFCEWVATLREGAFERYHGHFHRHLAAQTKEQLTQRALLDTVEQIYSEALDQLGGLPFDTASVGVQRGRCDLTPAVLESFDGFNMTLLDEVVQFNRGSCAISNFPNEHDPSQEYVATISRDLVAAWREFAINVNQVLLGKGILKV